MLCIKKHIIKIILIIAFLLYSFSYALFAEIDFNLIVPFGYNYTFSDAKIKTSYNALISLKNQDYYEVGVQSQIGYNFDTKNSIFKSISIMAEIGYQLSPMSISYNTTPNELTNNILFHTLHIGLIQKFYVLDRLSFGIGGGIRIPFSADVKVNMDYFMNPIPINNGKYDYSYIKSLFDSRVIPYIKLTMDGYYFFNDFVSLMIGLYITYSMNMNFNTDKLNSNLPMEYYHKLSYSSIGAGINIGIYIGRKGSNEIKRIE